MPTKQQSTLHFLPGNYEQLVTCAGDVCPVCVHLYGRSTMLHWETVWEHICLRLSVCNRPP